MNFKRSNILLLTGINPADIFSANCNVVVHKRLTKKYDEIPRRFTGLATWPHSTELLCWNCGLQFHNRPAFVPLNPEINKNNSGYKKIECDVHGNFCTWNCAWSYTQNTYSKHEQWDIHRVLCFLYEMFHCRPINKIEAAPSKTLLKEYSGNSGLTHQEYRTLFKQLSVTVFGHG